MIMRSIVKGQQTISCQLIEGRFTIKALCLVRGPVVSNLVALSKLHSVELAYDLKDLIKHTMGQTVRRANRPIAMGERVTTALQLLQVPEKSGPETAEFTKDGWTLVIFLVAPSSTMFTNSRILLNRSPETSGTEVLPFSIASIAPKASDLSCWDLQTTRSPMQTWSPLKRGNKAHGHGWRVLVCRR